MRTSIVTFLWVVGLAMFQLQAEPLRADSLSSQYQEVRSEYLRLMKIDPNVERVRLWDRSADKLTTFFNRYSDPDYSARAAYLLGRLYEYRYEKLKEENALTRAIYFYRRVADDYADHQLADDALLFVGDLEAQGNGNAEAAAIAYRRILTRYPDGDMFKKASKKLNLSWAEAREVAAQAVAAPEPSTASTSTASATTGPAAEKEQAPRATQSEKIEWSDSEKDNFSVLPIVRRFPKRVTIVIDPGHGGEEEGAHGVQGTFEKDIVLNISLLLDEMLRKRLKAKTVLTRVRDVHIELSDRTQLANDTNADLFISVHANASTSKRASGVETYYLDNTNDKSSLRLAKRENLYSGQDLDDLGFMLSDLIQNAKLDDSISLAHHIQDELYAGLSAKYPDLKNLGVKKAPFYVLVGAHMPCVLTEVSFIDNKVEGSRLITREYQKLVARSLFEGIVSYLKSYWKL